MVVNWWNSVTCVVFRIGHENRIGQNRKIEERKICKSHHITSCPCYIVDDLLHTLYSMALLLLSRRVNGFVMCWDSQGIRANPFIRARGYESSRAIICTEMY